MTEGKTSVEDVNNAVRNLGINASVASLPESHQNVPVDQAAADFAGEAEADANNSTDSN